MNKTVALLLSKTSVISVCILSLFSYIIQPLIFQWHNPYFRAWKLSSAQALCKHAHHLQAHRPDAPPPGAWLWPPQATNLSSVSSQPLPHWPQDRTHSVHSLLGLHHLPAPLKRTHQLWPKARWPLKWRVNLYLNADSPTERWPLHIKNWNTTSAERDSNNASQITAWCKEYNNNSKNGFSHNFTNILELHNQPVCLSKSISSYFPTWNPSSHFTQSSHTCHFCSSESYSFKCGQKALLGPSALLEVAPGHRRPLVFPLWLWTYRSLSSCQVVWSISSGENNLTSWKDICSCWVLLGYSKL